MKKLSFLVAVLAVVFAVGSAFIAPNTQKFAQLYFDVIDDEIAWNAEVDESDFLNTGGESLYTAFGCNTTPDGFVCAARFEDRTTSDPGELIDIVYKQ